MHHTADPTWDYAVVQYWTLVEMNIAIVIACLLVLKPLLAKMFPALLGPQPSPSPEDAPRTIGSDPLGRERGEEQTRYAGDLSEQSFVYQYENRSDVLLTGKRTAV